MSRGFVKDGDIEETPAVEQRAFLPEGLPNYVTAEGLAALKRERTELLARREAAEGNENDRRVMRNYLGAKLQLLEERIASAVLQEPPADRTLAAFGAYLTLRLESGEERTIRLVGADEADATRGLVSFFSPVARAVTGHRAGETPLLDPVSGRSITLLSVSYTPLPLTPLSRPASAPVSPKPHAHARTAAGRPEETGGREAAGQPEESERQEETGQPEESERREAAGRNEETTHPEKTGRSGETEQNEKTARPEEPERREDGEEVLPLVNERGLTLGKATRRECHGGKKLLHPVIHLHVFNLAGEVYLQKRPAWREVEPLKWDLSVGGHIRFGEPASEALLREAEEELGLREFEPVAIRKYIYESAREREFVYLYRACCEGPFTPGDEVEEGRFWSRAEIREKLGQGVFTPQFESEWRQYFDKEG